MKTSEKIGWHFAGLVSGVVVASLFVVAFSAAAAFFSGGEVRAPAETHQTADAR